MNKAARVCKAAIIPSWSQLLRPQSHLTMEICTFVRAHLPLKNGLILRTSIIGVLMGAVI